MAPRLELSGDNMNWRKTTELPDANELIWVLVQHWKENGPLSCEIYCGEVLYDRDNLGCAAFNNDDIGLGSQMWIIKPRPEHRQSQYDDKVLAWMPVNELPLPKWVPDGTR